MKFFGKLWRLLSRKREQRLGELIEGITGSTLCLYTLPQFRGCRPQVSAIINGEHWTISVVYLRDGVKFRAGFELCRLVSKLPESQILELIQQIVPRLQYEEDRSLKLDAPRFFSAGNGSSQ